MTTYKIVPMEFCIITESALGVPERSFFYGKAKDGQVVVDSVEHSFNTDLTVAYKSVKWDKVYEVPRDSVEIDTPLDTLTDLAKSSTFTYLEMAEGGIDE